MNPEHITVVYKWIAKPGQLDALTDIYRQVTADMQANEPGAESVHIYVSAEENALYVRDEFRDAGALGFHLTQTAAAHFPSLLAIATPGPFLFMGEVPEELQAATRQMGLASEFSSHSAGFDRKAHARRSTPSPRRCPDRRGASPAKLGSHHTVEGGTMSDGLA